MESSDTGLRPVATCDQVTRRFETATGEVLAIDRVDLEVRSRSLVALAGPSGSGKSTLLAMIGCLDRPTSGSVRVADQELSLLNRRQRRRMRRFTVVTLLPQPADNVLLERTGVANIELAVRQRRADAQATALLEELDISHFAGRACATLSGGEQQRIAIACALAGAPALVLADEPTGALDTSNAANVIAVLRAASARTTVVVATHDPALIEAADVVIRLELGRRVE
jgi:ABC-type lipoprotein export system ATPase subunit